MGSPTPHRASSPASKILARPYSSLVGAMLVLIFTSQNMQDVEISLIFGTPVRMPLILIIVGAFICGFGVATFVARRNRNRTMNRSNIDRADFDRDR